MLPKAPATPRAVIRRINAWLPAGCGGQGIHALMTNASNADSVYWFPGPLATGLHLRVASRLGRIARREHAHRPTEATAGELTMAIINLSEVAGEIIVTADDAGDRVVQRAQHCWRAIIAAGDADPDSVLAHDAEGLINHLEVFYPGRARARLPAPKPRP